VVGDHGAHGLWCFAALCGNRGDGSAVTTQARDPRARLHRSAAAAVSCKLLPQALGGVGDAWVRCIYTNK
jgi:hypothetical protein